MVIEISFCSSVVLLSIVSILSLRLRLYSTPIVSTVMMIPMITVQYKNKRKMPMVIG